jgi:hypothetical protein
VVEDITDHTTFRVQKVETVEEKSAWQYFTFGGILFFLAPVM